MFYPSIILAEQQKPITKVLICLVLNLIFLVNSFGQCEYQSAIEVDELQIGNMITWVTVKEYNNDKFIIQKSIDGIIFKIVGEVLGSKHSEEEKKYRYLDTALGHSKAYYRLIQIDKEGGEHYSPTVIINRVIENNFLLTGMSSPFTDSEFSCSLRSNLEGEMFLNIRNTNTSEIIDTKQWPIVKGLNVVTLDFMKYPIATYEVDFVLVGEKETIVVNKVDSDKVPNIDYVVKE